MKLPEVLEIRTPGGTWVRYYAEEPTPIRRPRITAWSQNDPRWRDEVYADRLTFGQAGCLVCCVAMIVSMVYDPPPEPPEVAGALRRAGAFIGDLLARPARIPLAFPRLSWGGVIHWRDRAADLDILNDEVQRYGATIVEVKWDPNGPPPQHSNQHFLVVEYVNVPADDLAVIDPWDGKRKQLGDSRYTLIGRGARRIVTGVRLVRAS